MPDVASVGSPPVVIAIGDLICDIVVDLDDKFRLGTDTAATVVRRRGGSAANVVAAATLAGGLGRFVGNVGDDDLGDELIAALHAAGVETAVSRSGRTGTVVSVVDPSGERSLLTDRGASGALAGLPSGALNRVDALHVPLYALGAEPLATVVGSALSQARRAGALTSVDASSVPLIELVGAEALLAWCNHLGVEVLFCNADEAVALEHERLIDSGPPVVIEKRGSRPAMVVLDGEVHHVDAVAGIDAVDTTGAGDAFAAGVLVARAQGASWLDAVGAGHRLASRAITQLGAL